MPPQNPGDDGEERSSPEGEPADQPAFRPPLPPEDRIWRHPSEVGRTRARTDPQTRLAADPVASRSTAVLPARTAVLMVISGMIGATMAVAAVAALGGFDSDVVAQGAPAAAQSVGDDASPVTSAARRLGGVAAIAERAAPTIAAVRVRHAGAGEHLGSAVVLRSDGHLLTSSALVLAADDITVQLADGTSAPARLVGADPSTDVAVLHIDHDALPEPALGSVADLTVGMPTIALGAMADDGWQQLVSTGVVSALHRRLATPTGSILHGMMLIDAPFTPGSAGGALVDDTGGVIGITTDLPATKGGDDRFGVATPIDLARRVGLDIVDNGQARHAWMGLTGADLPRDRAIELDLGGAVWVDGVSDGGPAQLAGLVSGDVIVAVDGTPVHSMSSLITMLLRYSPGDLVVLDVHRDGVALEVSCALGTRPDPG